MAIKALTFDNANNIESRNDAYWYNFITKAICGTSVGILNYGSKMEPHQDSNKIIFKHGYVVIHGRLIEIDDETELTIPFADIDKTVDGHIIIRIDLQKQPGQQVFLTTTTDTLIQNDLNTDLSGKYEFEIGTYKATHINVTNFVDKRTYINSDYNATNENLNSIIGSINSNYGVEKNFSSKWTKVDYFEFRKYQEPNKKWYMITYKEQFEYLGVVKWDNFSQKKAVFFNWCEKTARIMRWGNGMEDKIRSWLAISEEMGLCFGAEAGGWQSISDYDEDDMKDSADITIFRWDGPGIPVIAGGGLSF